MLHDRWTLLAPVDLLTEAQARLCNARAVGEALGAQIRYVYVASNRVEPAQYPAVICGPIGPSVARYAETLGAEMLVLTAGSSRWWKPPWTTPTAAQIAAATDLPVCFTRLGGPTPEGRFRSILCEVHLDGTDAPLLRFSQDLARRCDATLLLLHVLPEVSEALAAYGLLNFEDRPLSRHVALKRFEQLTQHVSEPHLTAIDSGPATRVLAQAVREHGADVVITSRRQGSPSCGGATSLLTRVSCPVVTVPVQSGRAVTSRAPVLAC